MIRSASRLAATSVALFMLASPAFAQGQPSANHLALAREVAVNSGMTRSFDAMTEPLLAQLQQMNAPAPRSSRTSIRSSRRCGPRSSSTSRR
jgi:hypothetical protein